MNEPPRIEKVSSKHITGCLSASISDDGQAAGIVFTVAGMDGGADEKLLLTLPAAQVDWFRAIGHHLVVQHAGKGNKEGKVLQPSINAAGEEDVHVVDLAQGEKHMVALGMSPGTAQESCHIMTPLTAIKVATLINQKMMARLTAAEKEEFRQFEERMRTAAPLQTGALVG